MSVRLYRLTPSTPALPIGLQFEAGWCYVSNPTGSPVLLRVGNPSIPTFDNTDYTVPALGKESVTVVGREFGVAFSDPTLISTNVRGNNASTATILFGTPDEPVPQFGAASFLSLSLSDLAGGIRSYSGLTTTQTFDISPYGGALIYVLPDAVSGQSVAAINVSSDGINWKPFGSWALWPAIPAIILIPRAVRYFQIIFNVTAIVGEPGISGIYAVRATIAEVLQQDYTAPPSGPFSKNVSAVAGGAYQTTYVTVGQKSVNVGFNNTGIGNVDMYLEVSPFATTGFRGIGYRDQRPTTVLKQINRNVTGLDGFMRVTIHSLDANPVTGTLVVSAVSEEDNTTLLDAIFRALGDVGNANTGNQNIYQELESSRVLLSTINVDTGHLASIELGTNHLAAIESSTGLLSNTNVTLANINSVEATNLPYLPLIKGQTDNLSSILTNVAQLPAIKTNADPIPTYLPTIKTNTDVLPSNLPGMKTDLDSLVSGYNGNVAVTSLTWTVAAGVWTQVAALPAGSRIVAFQFSISFSAVVGGSFLAFGLGTGAGLFGFQVYGAYVAVPWNGNIIAATPLIQLASIRGAGFPISNPNSWMYLNSSNAGNISANVYTVS